MLASDPAKIATKTRREICHASPAPSYSTRIVSRTEILRAQIATCVRGLCCRCVERGTCREKSQAHTRTACHVKSLAGHPMSLNFRRAYCCRKRKSPGCGWNWSMPFEVWRKGSVKSFHGTSADTGCAGLCAEYDLG